MATPRFVVDRPNLGKVGLSGVNIETFAQLATFAATAQATSQNTTDIGTLGTRVTTAETDIDTLQEDVEAVPLLIPSALTEPQGTETEAGLLELATAAEVVTGTDTERAVTPAGLAGAYTPTTALAELIRDTIGTALVAGSNVTITVDDGGDTITIASSGGGGGGTGTETLIEERVLASGSASETFTGIANTYRDLRVVVRGRGDVVATNTRILMQFNTDTGNNYDYVFRQNGAADQTGYAGANIVIGWITGSTAPANRAGMAQGTVLDYRGTTFSKVVKMIGALFTAASTGFTMEGSGWWNNTAAITEVKVFPASGNMITGSVISLYGIT